MRAIPALAPVTLPKHDKKGCYQLSEAVNVANSDPEENTNQRTLVRCNSSGRAGLNPHFGCNEGLGGTLDLCPNDHLAARKSISTKTRAVNQTLDNLGRRVRGRCQRFAQAQTGFA